MKVLVTGGAGFIGSAVVRHFLRKPDTTVINVDKLSYAGHPATLHAISEHKNHCFERVDICDGLAMDGLFVKYRPDAIVHLAAETHVDRSIDHSQDFISTNIAGTHSLLQAALKYWQRLSDEQRQKFRFVHVSTDEVYGDLGIDDAPFDEQTPYRPSSPYAASKASADHLVRAWHRTYGLPTIVTNCSNNYGPYQYPEKLIPLMTINALAGKELPIYGDGKQSRDWLHVDDHVAALDLILTSGLVGDTYLIGGGNEQRNVDVVHNICRALGKVTDRTADQYMRLLTSVGDRPGHDRRYAINSNKLRDTLGWRPQYSFDDGIEQTVDWYLNNSDWVEQVTSTDYQVWIEQNYSTRIGQMMGQEKGQ